MPQKNQRICTARLELTRFTGTDKEVGDMIKNWISDPRIQREYGEPAYNTRKELLALLERYKADPYRWAIYEKKSNECIGQIAFCKVWNDVRTVEIEYCIGTEFQGNGFAGEALSAIIDYSFFQTDFRRLEAYHRAENSRSGKVLTKSSMHLTDMIERFRREGIRPETEVCYCITADEWELMDHYEKEVQIIHNRR